MHIYNEYFIQNLEPNVAQQLFKQSIKQIEMAISSYCNRTCLYCPNHIVDRRSSKRYMSDALFLNIIRQLRSIDYSENITVHRYNEPLADMNYALLRISSIRSFLPKANIIIYTNGDYLNRDLLLTLSDIGVNAINATVHSDNGSSSFNTLVSTFKDRIIKLNMPFEYDIKENTKSHHAHIKCGNLSLDYQIVDFWAKKNNGSIRAFDRGGSLDNRSGFLRKESCLMPFIQMQIEYDGTLLPCCNIHPGLDQHSDYILGKLHDNSNLFVEWTNVNYVKWRKNLIKSDIKCSPCTHCDMNT